jgi:hypothetical protein
MNLYKGCSQLFVNDRKGITKMKNEYKQKIDELYAEVGKLTNSIVVAQKNPASDLTREQRLDRIEWESLDLPHLHRRGCLASAVPASTTSRSLHPRESSPQASD